MRLLQELKRGVITENPLFVLALGLCPALAVSNSAQNGFGMGLATTFVLVCSNLIISIVRHGVPDRVRIPCYIVVIATFVTIVDLLLKAYFPVLDRQLGIYVSLIVVNCIVLGRAEAYASHNGPWRSLVDGLVTGLGFTLALTALAVVRELAGANRIFGYSVVPGYTPVALLLLAPGGFITMGLAMGLLNHLRSLKARR
jgi:electron transport complex protein RnfE